MKIEFVIIYFKASCFASLKCWLVLFNILENGFLPVMCTSKLNMYILCSKLGMNLVVCGLLTTY